MRGAQIAFSGRRPLSRIIPADAGSTYPELWRLFQQQDHPRGCGEHASVKFDVLDAPGSSPRMRGARVEKIENTKAWRIIPADAGSTLKV